MCSKAAKRWPALQQGKTAMLPCEHKRSPEMIPGAKWSQTDYNKTEGFTKLYKLIDR